MIRVPTSDPIVALEACVFGDTPLRGVVAPPHPLYGGHLSNPVVQALCEGLVRRGTGALAFNWRGVGGSDGRASGDLEAACVDYRAALAHVARDHDGVLRMVAAGYSFGAVAALAVALTDTRVSEVIVVAPPIAMLPSELARLTRPLPIHVIAAEHDEFCPIAALERALLRIAGASITVIAGADHFFSSSGVGDIAAAVASPQ